MNSVLFTPGWSPQSPLKPIRNIILHTYRAVAHKYFITNSKDEPYMPVTIEKSWEKIIYFMFLHILICINLICVTYQYPSTL